MGKFSSASDTDRDAVIVAGGVAVHSRATAAYKLILPITFPTAPGLTDVTDVAILPGGGPGGTDALLAADSRGLLRTHYQVSGTYDPPTGYFVDPQVIEGTAWVDAGSIQVVDADQQGGLDIVGVAAGGMAVLTLIESGGSFVPGMFTLSRQVLGVVVSNWDSDAANEYVVLTTAGLAIYSLAGVAENAVPYNATSGAIARVTWPAQPSGTAEFIAWGRPKASGGGELLVLNRNVNEGAIQLNVNSCQALSFVPKAVLAGNYDLDESGSFDPYEDLLLVHEIDRTAVVLVNRRNQQPHFELTSDWHDVVRLDANFSAQGGVGLPAFAQVDGVGPEDLVFPVSATAKVQVFLNTSFQRRTEPQGGQPPPTSAFVVDDQYLYDLALAHAEELICAIQIPPLYAEYEQVQVILWKEDQANSGVSLEVDRRRYWLGGDSLNQRAEIHDGTVFPPNQVNWSEPRPYFYVELRFVDLSATGETLWLSPRYFAGFTLQEPPGGTVGYGHLTGQGIPPLLDLREPPDPGDTGAVLGAYIPMSSQPAFTNGQQPAPQSLLINESPTWSFSNTGT